MRTRSLKTVLHIDDDADVREAVRFGLQTLHGIQVRTCSSGREGLMAASIFSADLLLLDVMMTEIDGTMALAGLRQHPFHRHTPAIFLTAMAHDDDRLHYASLGAAGVIAKPFAPENLYQSINRILRRHQQIQPPGMGTELSMLDRVSSRELSARLATIHWAMDRVVQEPLLAEHRLHLFELVGDLGAVATGYGKAGMANAARRAQHRLYAMNSDQSLNFRDLKDIEVELCRWTN